MSRTILVTSTILCTTGIAFAGDTEWVNFVDETGTRLVSDPAVGASDVEEKDYAWADLDQDGDIDLVCVRKVPFTNPGGKTNVLFMNEGGVLTDRTLEKATDADDGGSGFHDLTNDRDVVIVDVNGDTWLDVVTATTLADGLPKTISHPRVYINKGEIAGVWQGLRYEEARTPQLFTIPGSSPQPPRFCSITAGDVTGDGRPELYFGDYDSSGAGGTQQGAGEDLNDRLFLNDGNGNFTDTLQTRMTSEMLLSAFGTAVVIADMNGDGFNDIVKDTGLNNPTRVSISYNNPANEGFFNSFQIVYGNSPYFISVGDLNSDGLLDIVITDDGTDRYLLNTGNNGSGQAQFNQQQFPAGASAGFGSNSVIADLNNDDLPDVLIADVDVDISGCGGRLHIYRNQGGGTVSFTEDVDLLAPKSNGTHDTAVFDINGDGWVDLVNGRCSTTEVWINQPPQGLLYTYPDGLPATIPPDAPFDFRVRVSPNVDSTPEPGTGRFYYSVDNGQNFTEVVMTIVATDLYLATIPATACTDSVKFYVASENSLGTVSYDPPGAQGGGSYVAIAAAGTVEKFHDAMELDPTGWTVQSDPSTTGGVWGVAEPEGTIFNGDLMAPSEDATNGAANVRAFVTENGPPGAENFEQDVDGGPTRLISPVFNLAGTDATCSAVVWHRQSETGDNQMIEVTANGVDWVPVTEIVDTNSSWQPISFVVSDYVTPSATVQVRFSVSDETTVPDSSVVESGVDDFVMTAYDCDSCQESCADSNDVVDVADLLAVLAQWGQSSAIAPCEFDGGPNDVVEVSELLAVLGKWGPCN